MKDVVAYLMIFIGEDCIFVPVKYGYEILLVDNKIQENNE